jgi:hypothetical protein
MSAMEQWAAKLVRDLLPPHFLALLTQENIDRVQTTILTEYQAFKDQLTRIETNTETLLINSGAEGWGARIYRGEGFVEDKPPLSVLMLREGSADDRIDYNNRKPNGAGLPYTYGSGSRSSSDGSGDYATGSGSGSIPGDGGSG